MKLKLLMEILAKNIDLSLFEKKILVNIKIAGDQGMNIKDLYTYEANPYNLRSAKESLLKNGLIEETDMNDFYTITDAGLETMKRASLIDDSNEIIDAHASEYYYDQIESNDMGL